MSDLSLPELISQVDNRQTAVATLRGRLANLEAERAHLQQLANQVQQHAAAMDHHQGEVASDPLAEMLRQLGASSANLTTKSASEQQRVVASSHQHVNAAKDKHQEFATATQGLNQAYGNLHNSGQAGSHAAASHGHAVNNLQSQSTEHIHGASEKVTAFGQENHDLISGFRSAITDHATPALTQQFSHFQQEMGNRQRGLKSDMTHFGESTQSGHRKLESSFGQHIGRFDSDGVSSLHGVKQHAEQTVSHTVEHSVDNLERSSHALHDQAKSNHHEFEESHHKAKDAHDSAPHIGNVLGEAFEVIEGLVKGVGDVVGKIFGG